jgi:hypothetical protein
MRYNEDKKDWFKNKRHLTQPVDQTKSSVRVNGAPNIIIYAHQGLGDQIDCNGLTRSFLDTHKTVFIFAKRQYIKMVEYMYRDTSRIQILPIYHTKYEAPHGTEFNEGRDTASYYMNVSKDNFDYLPVGFHYYGSVMGQSCSERFYNIAKIPYEYKISRFFYEREEKEEQRVFEKLNPENEEYIFVHDDPERGMKLNIKSNKKIIKNDKSENIFYMRKILENASEIHCMNSAIFCLIEHIDTTKNLYHYPVRGHSNGQFKTKLWKTVKYQLKK